LFDYPRSQNVFRGLVRLAASFSVFNFAISPFPAQTYPRLECCSHNLSIFSILLHPPTTPKFGSFSTKFWSRDCTIPSVTIPLLLLGTIHLTGHLPGLTAPPSSQTHCSSLETFPLAWEVLIYRPSKR
jgi:hypothetical protein